MKAPQLIALLEAEIALLTALGDRDVTGYFFILPPDTDEPLTEPFIGKGTNRGAYFKYLADKLTDAQRATENSAGGPFVGMPGRMR